MGEVGLDLDVSDEPQWYIPAGIDLPDLQRSLTVIEQFEKTPLDLEGKRAAQLLHKKRQSRRRRRHKQTTASDSEGEAKDDDDDDDGRKRKVARKAREREKYMSAQFIEDSDEEYGRDIEEFFAREAAVRERTALAAIDSVSHIGTMRPTGTKKRRRRQPSLGTPTAAGTKGRVAKRSRRSALSSSGMHDVDSEEQGEGGDHGGFNAEALRPSPAAASDDDDGDSDDEVGDDGGDDGGGGGDIDHDSDRSSRSFLAHRDMAAAKHRHSDPPLVASQTGPKPKARPRYRGVPIASQAPENAISDDTSPRRGKDDDDVGQAQLGQDQSPSRATTPVLLPSISHKGDFGRQATTTSTSSSNSGGPPKGRARLIISDEEE